MKDNELGAELSLVGICSVNREEWLLTDLACNLIDVTSVPLYETLGNEVMILRQTEMTTLFGSDICLGNILRAINNHATNLKQVITFDTEVSTTLKELADRAEVNIISFHELTKKYGTKISHMRSTGNSADTVFTISYTSGTSGVPKGVMLTNRNFLSAITNIKQLAAVTNFNQDDVYISYLPLAHVFDRLGCHTMLSQGAAVGFFGGKILEITQDLLLLKPTIFPSVPRLLNKVYDRVLAGVDELRVTKRLAFYQGFVTKQYYNTHYGWVNNKVFDGVIFSKARERLGGRVRAMITASAPIAPNVVSFLRCIFCCTIVEAYG